ncbi:TLP18.3/Psb32/MOLO-1 phosphatase superfamily protein [Mesocricetibacter intestinalis]|uniref:TLP18.3/Psb32/MOLO-1 phosphatase superfamily protein n=1 Tax=Mesocricetibacter intestinalis TaxID=1521930 RepID=A0A4R6VAY3_9PAST|nr:TPM domain-containing protein [Mesocricetibacter intestinalis]TDQ57154.1 TLP18.3/Psb32/MOLO-1 phosphatase superfamily protein [Mesocricetibacter intestinalis]
MSLFSMPFDKTQIERAIAQAEQKTSAELRVYIEPRMAEDSSSCFERGLQLFRQLEMENTAERNGVLIYIAYADRACAIIGDCNIHHYVGQSFWQQQYSLMAEDFAAGRYNQGMQAVIERIAEVLARYFPYQPEDRNELPDEVIINE